MNRTLGLIAAVATVLLVVTGLAVGFEDGFRIVPDDGDSGVRTVLTSSGDEALVVEAEIRDGTDLWVALDPGDGVAVEALMIEAGGVARPSAAAMVAGPSMDWPAAVLGVSGPERIGLRIPEGTGRSTSVHEILLDDGAEWVRVDARLDTGLLGGGEVSVVIDPVPED